MEDLGEYSKLLEELAVDNTPPNQGTEFRDYKERRQDYYDFCNLIDTKVDDAQSKLFY